MKIILGLGNPEQKYMSTYHNVGFMFVDELAKRLDVNIKKKDCHSLIGESSLNGEKFLLVKPQTYMNASGTAVLALKSKYKLNSSDFLVIVDDVDLNKGDFRYREKGSSGTHNGMRDITEKIGTIFPRLRIGIKPEEKPLSLADYVLSKIDAESSSKIAEAIDKGIEYLLEKLL